MSLQVILVTTGEDAPDPTAGWAEEFARLGWLPVRAKSAKQADYCIKSYPNAVIVVAAAGVAGEAAPLIDATRSAAGGRSVVAICAPGADSAALAAAGADFVLPPGAPFALFRGLVEAAREIARAKAGDASGESARALAAETRKLLHDLNQPLAVLQGRIEVMGMKAPEGDPMKEPLAFLREQAVRAAEIVAQLHELHRRHK